MARPEPGLGQTLPEQIANQPSHHADVTMNEPLGCTTDVILSEAQRSRRTRANTLLACPEQSRRVRAKPCGSKARRNSRKAVEIELESFACAKVLS